MALVGVEVQGSISLQLPGPEDLRDFPMEEELGGVTLHCLGKVEAINFPVSCWPRLGRVLVLGEALGKLYPVVSVTTTQVESECPIIFGDVGQDHL